MGDMQPLINCHRPGGFTGMKIYENSVEEFNMAEQESTLVVGR